MITPVPDDTQPSILDNEPTFEELAAAMPETAQGFLDAPTAPSHAGVGDAGPSDDALTSSDAPSAPRKSVNVSKKVRKAMNKFKGKVADVPIMWFHDQAKDHPEWELDADERELLTDSIETVFDVLDIQFEIDPLSYTLTSIWWVISYPLLAFTFLFLTKKARTIDKEQEHAEEVQP